MKIEVVKGLFENRWAENLSEEEYHADKTAVNSSSLKEMIRSPAAYYDAYVNGKKPTKAMKFGTLAHMAILEGDKFRSRYVVEPVFQGMTQNGIMSERSKVALQKKAEWYQSLPQGTTVVTKEELDMLLRMIDSMVNNKDAFEILSKGKAEAKGYFVDEETGLKCRFMADFISFNLNALVDIKTTTDCKWEKFRSSVEELRYDVQMAMYEQGVKAITGKSSDHRLWLTIETVRNFECRVHEVDPMYDETGLYEYRYCMKRLSDCIKENKFPQGQVLIEYGQPSFWFKQEYQLKGVL